jgi:hypothetical protein
MGIGRIIPQQSGILAAGSEAIASANIYLIGTIVPMR